MLHVRHISTRIIIIIIVSVIIVHAVPLETHSSSQLLIVGGTEATPHEFPWQVSLETSLGLHLCGGIILDKRTVLTTAACAELFDPFSSSVIAGKHNLTAEEECSQILRISSTYLHPEYSGSSEYSNDIAVVKTSIEFNWTKCVQPMTDLHDSYQVMQETGVISGWGIKREQDLFFSETLQKANVQLIANNVDCQALIGSQLTIEDAMLCIISPNSTNVPVDSCSGDHGGPLTVTNEDGVNILVGLISFGIGCGRPNTPSFCTRISPYIGFIEQYLESKV